MRNLEQLLASILLFVGAGVVFVKTRRRASSSPRARTRLLLGSGGSVVAGAVLAFWLPRYVPETPGSPGTLAVVALLWVIGGSLLATGLLAFIAALSARPRLDA